MSDILIFSEIKKNSSWNLDPLTSWEATAGTEEHKSSGQEAYDCVHSMIEGHVSGSSGGFVFVQPSLPPLKSSEASLVWFKKIATCYDSMDSSSSKWIISTWKERYFLMEYCIVATNPL